MQIVKKIKFDCSSMDITSISNNVLGDASQAMDSRVYLVQCVQCPEVYYLEMLDSVLFL